MKKRKVIIDCDPGIDDSLAIMLALKSPEIEVIGITIVCGNSPVEMGFGNAKKILKQMNRLDVPVYIGESTPLRRDYVNALDTHGEDGLGESFLPEVTGYQQQISAVDFLADVLKKEKVSIIELAPMTNLARLIQKDKEAFSCIEEIVSMGGSFKSHGNCSPVAEYNYWCDPDGASLRRSGLRAGFDGDVFPDAHHLPPGTCGRAGQFAGAAFAAGRFERQRRRSRLRRKRRENSRPERRFRADRGQRAGRLGSGRKGHADLLKRSCFSGGEALYYPPENKFTHLLFDEKDP